MADRDVQIKITTAADTAAAKATEKALEEVAEAQKKATKAAEESAEATRKEVRQKEQVHEAMKRETVATNGAAEAKEKLEKKSINAGYAMQSFGQFVNDLPYGISAVSNQVGQLAASFGLGAGLAGVLTIAATGVDQVVKHFDLFGTEATKAAEAARKEAEELRAGAIHAREAAEATEMAREATIRHEAAMRKLTETYQEQLKAIDQAAEARHRDAAAAQALADAIKEARLAEIGVAESTGEIGPMEAERKRREVEGVAAKDAEERRRMQAQNDAATAAEKANVSEAAAIAARTKSREMGAVSGVLTSEQRAAMEARYKEAKAAAKAAELERTEIVTKDSVRTAGMQSIPFFGGFVNSEMSDVALSDFKTAEYKRFLALEAAKRAAEALDKDKKARLRVGGMPAEKVAEEQRRLEEEAQKADAEAARQRAEVERIKTDNERQAQISGIRQGTAERQSDARIYGMQGREREAYDREQEKQREQEAREAAKLLKSAGAGGGKSDSMAEVLSLVRQLLSHTGTNDAATRKEIAELRAKMEALGSGK